MDGLVELKESGRTYYRYRQYASIGKSTDSGSQNPNGGSQTTPATDDRAVDFEAIIRVGWDNDTLGKQMYPLLAAEADAENPSNYKQYKQLNDYNFGSTGNLTALNKVYRTLIIEVSWPADVPWENRERRIFRVEMFNENFVPYPQTTP
jgi:hypothetical protein